MIGLRKLICSSIENGSDMQKIFFVPALIFYGVLSGLLSGCTMSPIQLKPELIRPWSEESKQEEPGQDPAIFLYKSGPYKLLYLASGHSSDRQSPTLKMTAQLFQKYEFDALLIEGIPFAEGESPAWYLKEAQASLKENFVSGEHSYAAILASEKEIPFYGGEPGQQTIYEALRDEHYSDLDILGFYLARQIPQWVREEKSKSGLIDREGLTFTANNCRNFGLQAPDKKCPELAELKAWYQQQFGRPLSLDVLNSDFEPLPDGKLKTQRMAAAVARVRDRYTLERVQDLLRRYKNVAVIYGAGHFIALRRSFDEAFGPPRINKN